MDSYLNALKAMHSLLDRAGEYGWRDWIGEDINQWETFNSVDHHLAAYGGMGSFNDIGFQDVWLDQLFSSLRSICYYFAKVANHSSSIRELENSLGTIGSKLEGWRCLDCGYAEVTQRDVERYVAYHVIRADILEAVTNSKLSGIVHSVFSESVAGANEERARINDLLARSSINLTSRGEWMRPCPNCSSANTAVYRWGGLGLPSRRFKPSERI